MHLLQSIKLVRIIAEIIAVAEDPSQQSHSIIRNPFDCETEEKKQ